MNNYTSKAEQYISEEAVHVSPKAVPVPTKTALYNLTKGCIVAEAEKLGIELDMELTKDQMVSTLISTAKKNAMDMLEASDPKSILDSYVNSFTG
jgi:hypothetical protein